MKQITEFDRANLKKLVASINKRLEAVGEMYGIKLAYAGCSFTRTDVKLKIVGRTGTLTAGGKLKVAASAALMHNAPLFLGKKFKAEKKYQHTSLGAVRFVDFRTRAPKRPFVVEAVSDGKQYLLTVDSAKRLVG